MLASLIITFRETLEAALIIGIILGYLAKTKNTRYNNIVYLGIGFGLLGSIISAMFFNYLAGGFTGRAEEIFEGVAMLLGAFFITTVILWMMNQKSISHDLKEKVSYEISQKHKFGLFFLVFVSVLREGVETVLFLGTATLVNTDNSLLGGILGVFFALVLGYLLFIASIKVNIKKFFNISSFLLLLFASGLVAHGVHELQEASVIPVINEHVYDINPYLDEDSSLGEIAKSLFGYNGNPSLLEMIAYITYLSAIIIVFKKSAT